MGFGGIFIEDKSAASIDRIELGYQQGLEVPEDHLGAVGKHESRHALFFAPSCPRRRIYLPCPVLRLF